MECPACGEAGISRLAALRPPMTCSACKATVVRAPHPLADAVELLAPPFIPVSILLSFFNWSLWPTVTVLILWFLATANIPLGQQPSDEDPTNKTS